MTIEEMQDRLDEKYRLRKRSKKGHFIIGPKFITYGDRGRRTITEGVEFKKIGRVKNKNPRYKAELRLGAE